MLLICSRPDIIKRGFDALLAAFRTKKSRVDASTLPAAHRFIQVSRATAARI
jgi:hypothetical protein